MTICATKSSSQPRISVVTATFNALEALKLTMDSVAAQTYPNIEHVIVDGGSRDGTVEFLESYAGKLNWISEPDEGIADALNKGFARANGEWVIVLGAEDTFYRAESVAHAIAEFDVDSDILAFEILSVRDGVESRLTTTNPVRRLLFKPLHHQGVFCRRTLFDQVGGFSSEFKICMDYEWFMRAKRQGARFAARDTIVSRMPATGVSARIDWPSLRKRLAEERLVQLRWSSNLFAKLMYAVYWPSYLLYRKLKCVIQ